eukprot:gene2798-5508_t
MSVSELDDEKILNEITEYCKEYQIRDMFKEYLKRLMVAQPTDPIAFLQKQVKTDPFVPPEVSAKTVNNKLYYARCDFGNPKLINELTQRLQRYEGGDLWIESMRKKEIDDIVQSILVSNPSNASAVSTIRDFILRHKFNQEIANPILNLFQKCAELNISIYPLDDIDGLSYESYMQDNNEYTQKVKFIMDRTSDFGNTSPARWVERINQHEGLNKRPQIIMCGVEQFPHLEKYVKEIHGSTIGFVLEAKGKIEAFYGPKIQWYISQIDKILSDIEQLGGGDLNEEDMATIKDAKMYLMLRLQDQF